MLDFPIPYVNGADVYIIAKEDPASATNKFDQFLAQVGF